MNTVIIAEPSIDWGWYFREELAGKVDLLLCSNFDETLDLIKQHKKIKIIVLSTSVSELDYNKLSILPSQSLIIGTSMSGHKREEFLGRGGYLWVREDRLPLHILRHLGIE